MPSLRPPRGSLRVLVVVPLVALAVALLPAGGATAAERTVAGGRLDWGIKSSFQRYVTGPVAQGSWQVNGGATTASDSLFRFHSAQGAYDPATGALRAGFSGGVRFTGHRGEDGSFALDLTIGNPTIHISGDSGTLYADMRSKSKSSGTSTTKRQVPLASLDLGGVNMQGGGSPLVLRGVPATLTAQGAESFAGYYPAGTPLDPVSLSADVQGAAGPEKDDAESSPDPDEQRKKDRTAAREQGSIADAALDWGVRRTFREYVTGPLAQGDWTVTGGAGDGGAVFRFTDGTGRYDPGKGELDVDFRGSVRFTGKDLDLRLDDLSVQVRDGTGELRTGETALVTFKAGAKALKPEDGLIHLAEAPAELTAEGAEFFDGMYQEGTAMAPVSLAVALDDEARLPALPDLGTDPAASASPPASASASPEASASSGSSASSLVLPLASAAALLAAGGGAWWLLGARRRRAAAALTPLDTPTDTGTPTADSDDNPKENEPR